MHIHKRDDIDPEEGIRKYGDVEFADSVNNKYPIDTAEHVLSAWARIHISRNAMFYSASEIELIKSRIVEAAKRLNIDLSQEVIERDAMLFTAGDYPDRGIEISEEDLDRMVESHAPAPIKVEHTDTPLELGVVTKLWRAGKDLFGKLAFTAPAWALIEASGAKKLSAAVKRDKSGIAEVSLVRHPRIAGAAIFHANGRPDTLVRQGLADGASDGRSDTPVRPRLDLVMFEFNIENGGNEEMSETKAAEFSKRIEELERQIREREVDSRIDSLKRDGKLTPACEELARVLLSAGESQVVTFSDGTEKPVAETFLAFLEAQPKVIEFSELAEGAKEEIELSDAEREFYAKLGVSPEAVGKHKLR